MCPLFQRRSRRVNVCRRQKKREECKVDRTTATPDLSGPTPAPFPSASPRQGQAPWNKEKNHLNFVLIGSFGCLWDFTTSLSHRTSGLQRGSRGSWAVEVDILPPALPAVPYSGLFWLAGAWAALSVNELRQADVSDAGGVVSDDVHVWVEDGGVDGLAVLGKHWHKGRL